MSQWQEKLSDVGWRITQEEKKRAKEAREKEKAERLQAEDRRRTVLRKMYEPQERRIQAREPINRQAAILLRKASQYSKPPVEPQVKQQPKQRGKPMGNKQLSETTLTPDYSKPHPVHPSSLGGNSGIAKGRNPEEYFNLHELSVRVIDEINKSPQKLTALARAAIDARGVLEENMHALGGGMEELQGQVKVALEDIRQSRFAFVSEVQQMLNPLKELRAFLLDHQYETEIKRLREFCDLCERLQRLKADGTLDALADTIIRLAVG